MTPEVTEFITGSLEDRENSLRLKIGPESRCSLIQCSGMELHHPIMSKLWDIGGRTKRKKKSGEYGDSLQLTNWISD